MNCPNCGAAMKLVDARDYFVCEYCTSFYFPTARPMAADGVQVLGERSDLNCPQCGNGLVAGTIERRRVLHCEQCRGVLATNPEFAEIVKRRRATHDGPTETPPPLQPEVLEREIRCPSCGRLMDTHPYYGPGNIVVDTCARCFLIWLDHGEIAAIGRAPGRR